MKLNRVVAVVALSIALAGIGVRAQEDEQYDVPFVPSPENVVEQMLKLANIKKGDILYDLGCGDGRIVITAAKTYAIKAVGVDINPERIKEANENARSAGVTEFVTFHQNDLFKEDISKATVVTLYLLPEVNLRLRPKLFKELKPGSRVVSHDFDMGDWKPDKEISLEHHKIYYWVIPENKAEKTKAQ
jgi:ubiquinone/menaquinone biosynthesis C-methylase UbiE